MQSTVIQNVALQQGWTNLTDEQARVKLADFIAVQVRQFAIAGEVKRQRAAEVATLTTAAETKITAA